MKKYNPYYPLILRDYLLTDLMTTHKGKKKLVGENYAVYTIVNELLRDYGINLWGSTKYKDSDITVRAMWLDKKFPLENFEIINQCYGYTNAKVDICIERNQDCEYSFLFDTETKSCTLQKYVWGNVEKDRFFNSFAEMWEARKLAKNNIEKMF